MPQTPAQDTGGNGRDATIEARRSQHSAPQRLSVILPVPLSLNNLYPTVRGRRKLSEAGQDYKHDAAWTIKDAAMKAAWRTRPGQHYRLHLVLHWPDQRRRDLSNVIKIVEDSAAEALGFDDSKVDELVVRRGAIDKTAPRCELTIEVLV